MATFTTPLSQIEALYVGYFGRAGDPAGANFWVSALMSGAISLARAAADFAVQPEATTKYPYLANPTITDPGAFVDQVYQNLFNHAADPAGKAYWVAQLQAGAGNPQAIGQFILDVISGATGADDATIRNKVDVAQDFTTKAANLGATWNSNTAGQSSLEIASVNEQASSVTAAKAATEIYFSTAPAAQLNFTLLTDSLATTAANANFNAPLIFNEGTGTLLQSLQPGDSAIDVGPNGNLVLIMNAASVVPLVTLKGIATHTVTSLTGGDGYSGDITGLVTLNNNNSAGAVTIGAAGNGIDKGGVAGSTTTASTLLGTVNINNVMTGATTVVVNSAALAGAADALAINLVGLFGTIGTPNIVAVKTDTAEAGAVANTYETISIDAAGPSFLALGDGAGTSGILSTTRINVAGAGTISLFGDIAENFSKVATIDATAQTGGVTVTGAVSGATGLLAGNTVLTSFKGGTGADSLDISSMTAAQVQAFTAGNLDGGMARDTLILGAAALNTQTPLAATGFEIIGAADGLAGTVDVSMLGSGVDSLQLFGLPSDAVTILNVPTGFLLALNGFGGGFGDFIINGPTGLTDVFNITDSDDVVAPMTLTGFEVVNFTTADPVGVLALTVRPSIGAVVTLNIVVNGTADCGCGPDFIAAQVDVGSGMINVSGAGLGGVGFEFVVASAINASGFNVSGSPTDVGLQMLFGAAGPINILGSDVSDALVGSPDADIINGGAGDDFLRNAFEGGAGAGDVLTGGSGLDAFSLVSDVVSGAGPLAVLYGSAASVTDMKVDPCGCSTDIIILSIDGDDYPSVVGELQADFSDQGEVPIQQTGSSGTQAILEATNEIVKLTQNVATAGLTLQQAFDTAIGSATITGATQEGAYFLMMYDGTNARMVIGIVDTTNGGDDVIEAGDDVVLIGSANMSASDYAMVNANQFVLVS